MPTVTDWMMVGITAAYVIATIFIYRANIKSANATREQLVESKRQYEDKKRIEIMPYLQFEQTRNKAEYELNLVLDSGDRLIGEYVLTLRMKNIGNGAAKDIAYFYEWDNREKSADRGAFPVPALSSSENQSIRISFAYKLDEKEERIACFLLRYRDLLDNYYTQETLFRFRRDINEGMKLIEIDTSSPVFVSKDNTIGVQNN